MLIKKISTDLYILVLVVYMEIGKMQLVSEGDEVNPRTSRAKRRVDAERQIMSSGLDYVILRVPGIYGRGRLPLRE